MLWWTLRQASARDKWVRLKAISTLTQVRDPRATAALAEALEDDFVQVRKQAAKHLAASGDQRAIEVLAWCLSNNEAPIRKDAADWICAHAKLFPASTVAYARVVLAIENLDYERAASYGRIAVKPLIVRVRALLGDANWDARRAALNALRDVTDYDDDALEAVRELIGDSFCTETVLAVFVKHRPKRAIAMCGSLLANSDRDLRASAIYRLGELGQRGEDVVEFLQVATRDENTFNQRVAAEFLLDLGNQDKVTRIRYAIMAGQYGRAAAEGADAVEPLLNALQTKGLHSRDVISALVATADPRAARAIFRFLLKSDRIGNANDAVKALEQLLAHSGRCVEEADLESIASLGTIKRFGFDDINDDADHGRDIDVDTSKLKRLAADELSRRAYRRSRRKPPKRVLKPAQAVTIRCWQCNAAITFEVEQREVKITCPTCGVVHALPR